MPVSLQAEEKAVSGAVSIIDNSYLPEYAVAGSTDIHSIRRLSFQLATREPVCTVYN